MIRAAQRTDGVIAGVLAHLLASAAHLSFETVSLHIQASTIAPGPIPATLDVFKSLWKEQGLKLLNIGLFPQILKHFLYSASSAFLLSKTSK